MLDSPNRPLSTDERMVLEFVRRFGPIGRLLPLGNATAERLSYLSLVTRHGSGWQLTDQGWHAFQ
jgi:hypothetical protein